MAATPHHVIRRGLIKVQIWKRKSKSGDRYSLSIVRLFRNGNEWKESSRFDRENPPLMRLVLDEAYTWMLTHGGSDE